MNMLPMVWQSLWVRAGTPPLLYSRQKKLANNNQFNYPQNIYCRIGFVIQTQRRRVETRSDFLLRPFFQTVCRRYCLIYCVLFYMAKLSGRVQQLYGFLHLYVSHRSALSLSHLLFCVSCLELWGCWSHWPVRKTDTARAFIWAFLCGFAFCLVFVFCSTITSPPMVTSYSRCSDPDYKRPQSRLRH